MDKQMSLDPKSVEGGAELTSGALLEKSPPPAAPAAGLTAAFGSSLNPPKQRVVRMLRHLEGALLRRVRVLSSIWWVIYS